MIATQKEWVDFCDAHHEAHILQTLEWGLLKSDFGWSAEHIINGDQGALVLFRKIFPGFTMGYIPKGPIGNSLNSILSEIDMVCKQKQAFFIKIEKDALENDFVNDAEKNGILSRNVQPRRTIVIDLEGTEEFWLSRMKQKTRYNIRLAEKKGVAVRESNDTKEFNRLMRITSDRDSFESHTSNYYKRVFQLFHPKGDCILLEASLDEHVLAAIMIFKRGKRAWYFYGASSDEHRNLMPMFLLQFEAMKWAAKAGCTQYDLWGIPDKDEEYLEKNFLNRSDGLWGVYRFKRGFGGKIVRSVSAVDRIYSAGKYAIFSMIENRNRRNV